MLPSSPSWLSELAGSAVWRDGKGSLTGLAAMASGPARSLGRLAGSPVVEASVLGPPFHMEPFLCAAPLRLFPQSCAHTGPPAQGLPGSQACSCRWPPGTHVAQTEMLARRLQFILSSSPPQCEYLEQADPPQVLPCAANLALAPSALLTAPHVSQLWPLPSLRCSVLKTLFFLSHPDAMWKIKSIT